MLITKKVFLDFNKPYNTCYFYSYWKKKIYQSVLYGGGRYGGERCEKGIMGRDFEYSN